MKHLNRFSSINTFSRCFHHEAAVVKFTPALNTRHCVFSGCVMTGRGGSFGGDSHHQHTLHHAACLFSSSLLLRSSRFNTCMRGFASPNAAFRPTVISRWLCRRRRREVLCHRLIIAVVITVITGSVVMFLLHLF